MKIMIIDDEKPALDELCFFLKDYPVKEIKTYMNPLTAVKEIAGFRPDIVFIDIELPQMNGIDFGDEVRSVNQSTCIVFVSAYSQYALEAYRVHPSDYVIKPINASYFQNTMKHIMHVLTLRKKENEGSLPRIQCFGKLEVYDKNGRPVKFATKKTKELLAFYLVNTDRIIYRNELLMQLFPGTNPEKALNNFYVSLHRLRKALELSGLERDEIIITENGISFIKEGVCPYVDLRRTIINNVSAEASFLNRMQRFLELYKNDLLIDLDFVWLDEERKWLEVQMETILLKMAGLYEKQGEKEQEEIVLQKLIEMNPYSQEGYEAMLNLYRAIGNKSDYRIVYKKYAKLMQEEWKENIEKVYADYYKNILI